MTTKADNAPNIINDYLNRINRLDELFDKNKIKKDVKISDNDVTKSDKDTISKLTSLPKLMRKLRHKKGMK